MEYAAELLAVVVSTDKSSSTLQVTVTIPLALDTGVTGSAASALVHIPALTSRPRVHDVLLGPGPHAAVVLGVEHGPELLAVVVAAHQAGPTLAAVVTVPLSLLTTHDDHTDHGDVLTSQGLPAVQHRPVSTFLP